jgi:hypothetical protein
MRFARVKCDDYALVREIDHYILHAVDFHQGRAQLTHAFIAIFAFSCDLDRFQDRVVGPFPIKWIGRVWIVWSCWIHRFLYLTSGNGAAVVSCVTDPYDYSQVLTKIS